MFTAFMVLCLVQTGDCQKFVDERGPYKTEVECAARLDEMAEFAVRVVPLIYPEQQASIKTFCKADLEV